jgi:hypothetical protein
LQAKLRLPFLKSVAPFVLRSRTMRCGASWRLAVLASVVVLNVSMAGGPGPVVPGGDDPTPKDANQSPAADAAPTDELLAVRLKLIEQGLVKSAKGVPPHEAVTLHIALKARVDHLLAKANEHPSFRQQDPAKLEEFEKLFWSMHVLTNQVTSGQRFIDFGPELQTIVKKNKAKLSEEMAREVLQVDWAAVQAELSAVRQQLTTRERDGKIARLKLVDKVLRESNDGAERLLAALALDLDGESLPQQLAKDASVPAEDVKQLKETIKQARTAAGPEFIQKARWLFTGLHWWMRGRYGLGMAGGGLLKEEAALQSSEAMFGLLMPIATPVPTEPTALEPVPLAARRHHYLWQLESRQIGTREEEIASSTSREYVSRIVTTTSRFY